MAKGRVEGVGQLLHHGWFVVRNRAEGDDNDPNFDLQGAEAELFREAPWTQIRETRRGSAMLRKYLGELLCNKIETAFPHLLAKLRELLNDDEASLARLGEPRSTHDRRRAYLVEIAQQYQAHAREALERPWHLDRADARVRCLVSEENNMFAQRMREFGHVYEFEDHSLKERDCIQRLRDIIEPGTADAQPNTGPALGASVAPVLERDDPPVRDRHELFAEIRKEVLICGCTGLPGQVHPDIIHRLYSQQTRKWRDKAAAHLKTVAAGVGRAAEEILDAVCPRAGRTGVLHEELRLVLRQFHDGALRRALETLHTYCDGDQMKLLQTTDTDFLYKLRLLQSVRMMKTIDVACKVVYANKESHSLEDLELLLFNSCHHSTTDNKVNEVHDALKVYYEVCSIVS